MAKKYITSHQSGGPVITGANQMNQYQQPLNVRIQQEAIANAPRSRASSKKSGSDLLSLSDIGKLGDANSADKQLELQELMDMSNNIDNNIATFGTEWATQTKEGRDAINDLTIKKANLKNRQKGYYDYVTSVETAMTNNGATDAYVQPSIGTFLVYDHNNQMKEVSFEDFRANKDAFRRIKNSEFVDMRRNDPNFAKQDQAMNGALTNLAGSLTYGPKLIEGLSTIMGDAGFKDHLVKVGMNVKSDDEFLSNDEIASLLQDGHNDNQYMTKTQRGNLEGLADMVLQGQLVDPSLRKGLMQNAYANVEETGGPREGQSMMEAVRERAGAMLLKYIRANEELTLDPYVDKRKVASAGADKSGQDAFDVKINEEQRAILGHSSQYTDDAGVLKVPGHTVPLNRAVPETLAKSHIANSIDIQGNRSNAKIRLSNGKDVNYYEFTDDVVPEHMSVHLYPVDKAGNPFTGYLEVDGRSSERLNNLVNQKLKDVSTWAESYYQVDADTKGDPGKSLKKATDEFYKWAQQDDDVKDALGLPDDAKIEDVQKKLDTQFQLKPMLRVEGFVGDSDYATGERNWIGGRKSIESNMYNEAHGTKTEDTEDDVYTTVAYIPLTYNMNNLFQGKMTMKDSKIMSGENDQYKDSRFDATTNSITTKFEGGKLITFNDL